MTSKHKGVELDYERIKEQFERVTDKLQMERDQCEADAKLYKRVLDRTAQERDRYRAQAEKYRVALEVIVRVGTSELFENVYKCENTGYTPFEHTEEYGMFAIAKQALEGDEK